MKLQGRRVVFWDRRFLTRRYWREFRTAMTEARDLAAEGRTAMDAAVVAQVRMNARLHHADNVAAAKAHALTPCTPCREWLTALAWQDEAIKAWLIDNRLVAASAFDFDVWLAELESQL